MTALSLPLLPSPLYRLGLLPPPQAYADVEGFHNAVTQRQTFGGNS